MDFYAPELDSLQFLVCGRLYAENDFVHMRRVLDCNVLIFVLEGTLFITQEGSKIAANAGDILLLGEELEHFGTRRSEGRLSYLWVHFCTDTPWRRVTPGKYVCHIPELFTARDPRKLRRLFEMMTDYSRRGGGTESEMTRCALKLLLLETSSQADSDTAEVSPLVAKIGSWIRQNCHRRLTVSDIAGNFHYSPDYLSSVFRRETGEPLSIFLNNCRIELAKTMLAEDTVSIKEVAYSCGFSDEKYFTRAFTRTVGMTPSGYRRNGQD